MKDYLSVAAFGRRLQNWSPRFSDAEGPLLQMIALRSIFRQADEPMIDTIPSDTMTALTHYPWPGNIRELQILIERSVILTSGPVVRKTLSGSFLSEKPPRRDPLQSIFVVKTSQYWSHRNAMIIRNVMPFGLVGFWEMMALAFLVPNSNEDVLH